MWLRRTVAGYAALVTLACQAPQPPMAYPATTRGNQSDDYFGTSVADPYRWLEDSDSQETRSWIDAQNRLTESFLSEVPARAEIKGRLTELWNYERYGTPSREGPHYVFTRNDGLQNQSVLYRTSSLGADPVVLLDPNRLSTDGTISLTGVAFSDDGRHLAYATSASGSDWMEWRVKEVATGLDLADHLQWSKFSGAAWRKDGKGFFYCRYEAPTDATGALSDVNKHQRVYYHALGTPQDRDQLVYARPDQPEWLFDTTVTDDGRFLLIYQSEGTEPKNRVFVKDLSHPGSSVEAFLDRFDAEYTVVGNDGDTFYVKTDYAAPRGRLVAIDRTTPAPADWRILVPEGADASVMSSVTMVHETFAVVWMTDAHEAATLYALDGSVVGTIGLPGLGTIGSIEARRRDSEAFYAFSSFTAPTTIYRFDATTGTSSIFRQPSTPFASENYETRQVFYQSKDGTRIPMFVSYRKGLRRNGLNPTYLYGYGGFNVSLTPSYSPAMALWLEMGGIFAVANIRGGGEYGKIWHDAGRLDNKQNVFDDFIWAAQYLIRENYTSSAKLAIAGGSNGGLLVGACMTQRPDLFAAALPSVGVMDMLRFHLFTIGWAWTSDYGSAETKEGFAKLMKYSPLHNLRPGIRYPATFITTADHDDRVVPGHSFKFAAALQAVQAGPAPALIRVETKAGHGAGKPTSKAIEERADMFAFLVRILQIETSSVGR